MPSPSEMNKPSSKAGKPHKPPSSDTVFSMPHDEILDNFDLDDKDDDKTLDNLNLSDKDGTCKIDSDCVGNECCSKFGFCGEGEAYCDEDINMDDRFEYDKAKQKSDRKKKSTTPVKESKATKVHKANETEPENYDKDARADNFGRRILRPNEAATIGSGKPMKTRLRRRSVSLIDG